MTHCDDLIGNDETAPSLFYFLFVHRLPAIEKNQLFRLLGKPHCYASWEGKRVRLVMASRLGDVGITDDLEEESRYIYRVNVDELSNFSWRR